MIETIMYALRHNNWDGKGQVHYDGAPYGINGEEGLAYTKLRPTKRNLNRTTEVKHWNYEIVPVKVTMEVVDE